MGALSTRDVAAIDRALERAREKTARVLAVPRRRRAARRRPLPFERRRARLARALERLRTDRVLRDWNRDERMRRTREDLDRGDSLRKWDALTACLQIEAGAQAKRCVQDVRVRELLAEKLRRVGERFNCDDVLVRADKLEKARRRGWAGIRESDGAHVVRMRDRSGLIMLDPADSRERTAELIERVMPLLLECVKQGYELHKFVVTEPNVPAGSLRWGKEQIFTHFLRKVLERDASGQEIPRTCTVRHNGKRYVVPNPARKFPELVGAIAIQEDPLARDGHHWNQHLNVLLVIDRGLCTPLAPELWPIDPETGEPKRDPALDHRGMFSWMKLRHEWGYDVHSQRVDPRELHGALLEIFKYATKTVSEKSLQKFDRSTPAPGHSPSLSPTDQVPALELVGEPAEASEDAARRPAPAMIDWPDARVLEWLDANKGFRRVRAWGCLYKIGKLPRATDPDEGIRWLGPLTVTAWSFSIQRDFFDADHPALPVTSIRENKSRSEVHAYRAQGPPRPGPPASS